MLNKMIKRIYNNIMQTNFLFYKYAQILMIRSTLQVLTQKLIQWNLVTVDSNHMIYQGH